MQTSDRREARAGGYCTGRASGGVGCMGPRVGPRACLDAVRDWQLSRSAVCVFPEVAFVGAGMTFRGVGMGILVRWGEFGGWEFTMQMERFVVERDS